MSASVLSLYFTKIPKMRMAMWAVSLSLPDVPHHDVDKSILDEAEKHKEGAGGHKHVNRLEIEMINCSFYFHK